MEPVILFFGALVASVLGFRAFLKPPRQRAMGTLQHAATLLGGTPTPSPHLANLEVAVDGLVLDVKLHGLEQKSQRARETCVRAAAPAGPRLVLLPRGVATAFGRAVGGQDVATGDPAFDARFMVKAADDGLVRAWLTERVRAALLCAPEYSYELDGERALASRLAWESDPERLCAAIEAVATLARSGFHLYASWCAIAAEMGAALPPGQAWPASGLTFDLVVLGTPLRVECTRRPPERELWHTRVLAPATGRELPAALRTELDALDAEAGLEGAGVFVRWSGVEPERERLARAVALIAEWAGARGTAAYR